MVYKATENTRKAAQERRAHILTTALEHMGDVGWQSFNVHTVAERMGVAVGTVYTYFANTDELVAEAIGLLAHSDRLAMVSTHNDPVVRLSRAVRLLMLRSNANKVMSGAATHPHYRATITRALEEAIADCARAGVVSRINPSLFAHAVYGMVFNVLTSDPSPSPAAIKLVQAMTLRMCCTPELEVVG